MSRVGSAVPGGCLDGAGCFVCRHAAPAQPRRHLCSPGAQGEIPECSKEESLWFTQRVWLSVNVVPKTCQERRLF